MTERIRESLSVLMDGEATEIDMERVLKHVGHAEVRATWVRYHRVRHGLVRQGAVHQGIGLRVGQAGPGRAAGQGAGPVPHSDFDVSAGVMAAIHGDSHTDTRTEAPTDTHTDTRAGIRTDSRADIYTDVHADPAMAGKSAAPSLADGRADGLSDGQQALWRREKWRRRVLRPAASLAVAASFFMVALFVGQLVGQFADQSAGPSADQFAGHSADQSRNLLGADASLQLASVPGADASPQLASVPGADASPQLPGAPSARPINTIGGVAVPAGYATAAGVPARPNRRNASNTQWQAGYNRLAQERLQRHLAEHAQATALHGPQGVLPYARAASLQAQEAQQAGDE